MLAEGKNPVKEALNSGKTIEKILVLDKIKDEDVRQIVAVAREKKIPIDFVLKQALDRVSKTKHHQGVIAYLSEFEYTNLDDVLSDDGEKFIVILDKLSDPHNLGSILRTAECVGVSAVVIPSRNSVTVNETVLRTSAGAANYVKVCKVTNINDAIKKIKQSGVFVYALDMDGKPMDEENLTANIAIIVGSEGAGVSALTKKLADGVVSIPMKGKINSLNASVSAAVVMYEILRQRKKS